MEEKIVSVEQAVKESDGLGFERVIHIPGSTFRDVSTVLIVPTRGSMHYKAAAAIQGLIAPMNSKRAIMWASGHEVGQAYNMMVENILNDLVLSKWKYIMTIEDDNTPPPDAHIRLLESIEYAKFDAVSGIYFTKGDYNMPMAYGNPKTFKETGELDFRPRNITEALQQGNIMEVNGIGMGCALWRMDLFREICKPWFVTVNDVIPGKGVQCNTQDLYFCERARRASKTFAVDLRVRVGHVDASTGTVY